MKHFSATTYDGEQSNNRGLCIDGSRVAAGLPEFNCITQALTAHRSELPKRMNKHFAIVLGQGDAKVSCQIRGLKCCHLKRAKISPSLPELAGLHPLQIHEHYGLIYACLYLNPNSHLSYLSPQLYRSLQPPLDPMRRPLGLCLSYAGDHLRCTQTTVIYMLRNVCMQGLNIFKPCI